MENRQDETCISRNTGKSMVGDYSLVELVRATSHVSHLKVHQSFLMLCMDSVTCDLCCSLGLLGKAHNNAAKNTVLVCWAESVQFFSVEKFLLNLNADCGWGLAWIPGEHLPEPHLLLSPLARLLFIVCSNPVLALLCGQWLQTPAARRGIFALAVSAMARKSISCSSVAF